jgi:hypothetical protein
MSQNTDAVVLTALYTTFAPPLGEQDGWRGGGYKRVQNGCCGRQVCDAELGRQVRWWEKEEPGPRGATGDACVSRLCLTLVSYRGLMRLCRTAEA